MPFSMKLWQVQGKDLKEVRCDPLIDEAQLQDWLAKDTDVATHGGKEVHWVVERPDPVPEAGGRARPAKETKPPPSGSTELQLLRVRAENGDAAAQASLGFRYELGIELPVDGPEAVKWYRKAAELGNARAKSNLALIADRGFMDKQAGQAKTKISDDLHWCGKLAANGNSRAQFYLGQMYEWGDGAPQDIEEAAIWYLEAAEQGEPAAAYKAGLCYCNGKGVTQNTAEAVRWWNHAAEHGDPAAQYMLGLCYCNAQGVPQDYALAVHWFRKAADQGEAPAQAKLGDAFFIGVGVAANHAVAAQWYQVAAEQGDSAAQRHLGIMYGLGQGVPQDYVQAYKWYTLAAEQHDTNAVHNRDTIASSMSPQQILEGKRLAEEFRIRKRGASPHQGNGHAVVLANPKENLTQATQTKAEPKPAGAASASTILGIDLLILGRKLATASGGVIDLLAMNSEGNLVALELKRDKAPQEIVAQTLDHASWIKGLGYEQIDSLARNLTGKALAEAFNGHFGKSLPERVNTSHSMIILASEMDDSSTRIMKYLSKQHNVPIQVHFMGVFKTKAGEFLGRVGR